MRIERVTLQELRQHPDTKLIQDPEAREVLRRAVEQRAVIRLSALVVGPAPHDDDEAQDITHSGPCILKASAMNEQALEARPAENARGVVLPTVGTAVEVTLLLRGASCGFDATVVDASEREGWIQIGLPRRLFLVDRRRSQRRELRRASRVCLASTNGSWSCVGSLLNVSVDGLACRVNAWDLPQQAEDHSVHADFDIEDHFAFRLKARVAGVAPAADEGFSVISLAFLEEGETSAERHRLRAALAMDAAVKNTGGTTA